MRKLWPSELLANQVSYHWIDWSGLEEVQRRIAWIEPERTATPVTEGCAVDDLHRQAQLAQERAEEREAVQAGRCSVCNGELAPLETDRSWMRCASCGHLAAARRRHCKGCGKMLSIIGGRWCSECKSKRHNPARSGRRPRCIECKKRTIRPLTDGRCPTCQEARMMSEVQTQRAALAIVAEMLRRTINAAGDPAKLPGAKRRLVTRMTVSLSTVMGMAKVLEEMPAAPAT